MIVVKGKMGNFEKIFGVQGSGFRVQERKDRGERLEVRVQERIR